MAAMSYLESSTLLFVIQAGEMGIMRAGGMDKPAVGPERLGSALKLLILIGVVGKIGLSEANDVGVEECQRIKDNSFFNLCVKFAIDVLVDVYEIGVSDVGVAERGDGRMCEM
jgi:hypothetical protein